MFVLFDEPVAECWNDVEVEVVIDDVQSSEFCVKLVADWINPYTYTFIAPGNSHAAPTIFGGVRKYFGAEGFFWLGKRKRIFSSLRVIVTDAYPATILGV